MIITLILLLWQTTTPTPEIIKPEMAHGFSKIDVGIFMGLATLLGAGLKSLFDFITGYRRVNADIDKTHSDIKKSDNEIIAQYQDKLLAANKLFSETQDKIDIWIRRFEKTSEDAAAVEDELRDMRRNCRDCIETRQGYYDWCMKVDAFFERIEPIFISMANPESEAFLFDLKSLRLSMDHLQKEVAKDIAKDLKSG